MEKPSQILKVLGVDIAFRNGVDFERVRQSVQLLEEYFTRQKQRNSGGQGKEKIMLTLLALSLADDLLQTKNELEALRNGLASTLEKIKKSV